MSLWRVLLPFMIAGVWFACNLPGHESPVTLLLIPLIWLALYFSKPSPKELRDTDYQNYLNDTELDNQVRVRQGLERIEPYSLDDWQEYYGDRQRSK